MRISRDEMLMEMAFTVAKRSTCLRLQVGAIAARDARLIASGYAGAPKGVPHCNETNCSLSNPCLRTTHAEASLISFASRHGVSLEGSVLYVTHSPCYSCSGIIINAGFREIVYNIPYRKTEGIELLESVGILVRRLI